MYVYVDQGSNISAELMKEMIHEVYSQLCPVLTEAPWGIGLNEESHQYLQKIIDRIIFQKDYDTGQDHEVQLADVEIGWNYA